MGEASLGPFHSRSYVGCNALHFFVDVENFLQIQQFLFFFQYGQSINEMQLQDLRGKVGKGGVAGGTRLLGTDRSVLTGSLALNIFIYYVS